MRRKRGDACRINPSVYSRYFQTDRPTSSTSLRYLRLGPKATHQQARQSTRSVEQQRLTNDPPLRPPFPAAHILWLLASKHQTRLTQRVSLYFSFSVGWLFKKQQPRTIRSQTLAHFRFPSGSFPHCGHQKPTRQASVSPN